MKRPAARNPTRNPCRAAKKAKLAPAASTDPLLWVVVATASGQGTSLPPPPPAMEEDAVTPTAAISNVLGEMSQR